MSVVMAKGVVILLYVFVHFQLVNLFVPVLFCCIISFDCILLSLYNPHACVGVCFGNVYRDLGDLHITPLPDEAT